MKYTLDVKAYKEVPDTSAYSYDKTKTVNVTEAELFEAVSKYLQVKGFSTEILAIEASIEGSK